MCNICTYAAEWRCSADVDYDVVVVLSQFWQKALHHRLFYYATVIKMSEAPQDDRDDEDENAE